MPRHVSRTLIAILDNQVRRTHAALEGIPDDVFGAPQRGDCASIRDIGAHLLKLRRFQLSLLDSPLAAEIGEAVPQSAAELATALDDAAALVRRAIDEHDPDDWHHEPQAPREGPWGDLPTLERIIRPLNDFTNHLGSIRTIRRQLGAPAERTQ